MNLVTVEYRGDNVFEIEALDTHETWGISYTGEDAARLKIWASEKRALSLYLEENGDLRFVPTPFMPVEE